MLTYAGNSVRFAHDICFSFPLYRVIFCFQPGLNNVQGLAQIMCCMTGRCDRRLFGMTY